MSGALMGMFMATGGSTANTFTLNITANSVNPDIRALCVAAGWNQAAKVLVNVTASLINRINLGTSVFPGGIEIVFSINTFLGNDGNSNGAFATQVPVTIDNKGTFAGIGGLGGRGESFYYDSPPKYLNGGAGGAGQRFASGSVTILAAEAGAGGQSANFDGVHSARAGRGGAGGSWGNSGADGENGLDTSGGIIIGSFPPQAGFAGGAAVSGNSYITWKSTGTRLGGIV